ncbi:lipolytic protein G-D-S-L family [Gemmatirosa kalamazoonensis]|uniref:Lipolytic protein G-D-S-L family n=1 Tax=Gemmatirosa kalamazoonensis TaxID=861299 RepID=W0RGT4_9BACT|nr:SGNH/GDSL hydrolase family protein [Gemmatirosa kalamazoonensis]AHG89991.1 lipolytic protein G-D-S-L family [Gemmatirosa kalamazoonensis]
MTMRILSRAGRRALVAGATAASVLAACAKDAELLTPPEPANSAAFMARYVALGNSITAGFQSDGINDSTQKQSYARLLAAAAGTRYAYAALAGRGCRPPLTNFLLQTRVGGGTALTCDLRATGSINAVLNNVAVPGANSFDPTGQAGGGYSALTTFILGGLTQVQKAVEVDPTFATVWIGNNDVLSFALGGTRAGVTDSSTFVRNYARMIDDLRAGSPNLTKGVLIGVVNVVNAPLGIPISVLDQAATPSQPAFAYQPAAAAAVVSLLGHPIAFAPNCSTGTPQISIPALQGIATAIAALPAAAPFTFVCADIPGVATKTPGLLSDADRTFFVNRVAGWNGYIHAKADSIGFAYYDPNTRLFTWRATGQVPPFPNLAAPAGTSPFGQFVSFDGVHPSAAAHLVVAQDLVALINQKYGSSIPSPTANP